MSMLAQVQTAALQRLAADVAEHAWPTFKAAGWTYHPDPGTPTVAALTETVSHLLASVERMAKENPGQRCAARTGRFCASYAVDGHHVIWSVNLEVGTVIEDASRETLDAKYADETERP